MQATITYLLSEQAQRVQMAATGQPVARKQVRTIEVSAEQLMLMAVDEDGIPYLDIAAPLGKLTGVNLIAGCAVAGWWENYNLHKIPEVGSYDAELLALIVAGIAARDAAAAAKAERKVAEAAKRQADWQVKVSELRADTANIQAIMDRDPDATPAVDTIYVPEVCTLPSDLHELRVRLDAERSRRLAEQQAEQQESKKAAEALRKSAKIAAMTAFVSASGDPLLRQQYADGLLSRDDLLTLMADAALDAAGLPPECPDSVVCRDSACPCRDDDITVLPREIYARYKALGELPEGSSVEFREVRNCLRGMITVKATREGLAVEFREVRNCLRGPDYDFGDGEETAGPEEHHAIVTIPSGPFQFKRRIKL
jgi:hypothetical protein